MGASRDYTAGARAGTATLTRPAPTRRRPRMYAPASAPHPTPGRTASAPRVAPHVPRGARGGRLGSQQVVSVRGRRVSVPENTKKRFSSVTIVAVPLLVAGVVFAMMLSGMSTNQSFTIQQLQSRERALKAEVESLNRDLGDVRSTGQIAQRAAEAGMVVPGHPGILVVDEVGEVHEQRAADPETTSTIIDVNGAPTRANGATSDRNATDELGDSLTSVPGGNVLGRNGARGTSAPENTTPEDVPAPAERAPINPAPAERAPINLAPYAPNAPSAPSE
ncbi:hypothetical protein [Corynebacterium timonense]|uniref:Cell division protein FtsL n=1 Tax=Corynebacterium timonense TaxID=441500 RepID=A0A1H1MKS6_9CORY|nr:hypothetical protein [Corynebacterium timonense]SDR87336.1 hypothetical protein SAMN04488539_0551 [Corynebacterium timonense]